MQRRRLAVLAPTIAGLVLGISGCTLPTSDDGNGYGPGGKDAQSVGAYKMPVPKPPAPVTLKSGVTATMKASNSSWTPANYVVASGASIVIKVVNGDQIQHTFTLEDGSLSQVVPSGGQTLVKFAAPGPGRHRFYCKYQRQEMQGWITVT